MNGLKAKLIQEVLYIGEHQKQKRENKVIARIDGNNYFLFNHMSMNKRLFHS